MQNPKKKYIRSTLTSGLKDVVNLNTKKWINNEIDLKKYINLPSMEFVEVAFKVALQRNASAAEKEIFQGYINNGATNAALGYIILSSDEIPQNIQKLNVQVYKTAFEKFSNPKSIKNNKFTRWLHAALFMPVRSKALYEQEPVKIQKIDKILSKIGKIDVMSNQMEAMQKRILSVEQNILDLSSKIDRNQEVYVKEANQNLGILSRKMDEYLIDIQTRLTDCKTVVTGFSGGTTVVQLSDNTLMGVPSEEWRLALYLSRNGHFEYGSEKRFKLEIKPEMNVVDIGANLGIYTLHALKAGCKTYSFEPAPRTFELLKENILLNGYEGTNRYFTYNNAVADKEQDMEFAVGNISGHNSFYPEEGVQAEKITVHCVTLDDKLKDVPHIDFVKIDVEGAEPLVLRGMRNIIARSKNIRILMEFAPSLLKRSGADPQNFISEIRSYGLRFQAIDDLTGELYHIDDEKLISAYSINLFLEKAEV